MRLRGELVVLPCVSFGARARLATDSGALTPIELIALRGIAAGLDEVQSLAQVVGLGQRPTLDLIYDFWLKGYVVVDSAQARVRLAGAAEAANKAGGLATLATAENNLEVVPLIQELVSGAVLPHIGRPHPLCAESAMVPTLRPGLSLNEVTRGEILAAVKSQVERQARKLGRPLVAQEAWIEPDQLLTEAATGNSFVQQRRFLPVWADIEMDPDSGRLHFRIIEAPEVPPPVCKDIERHLSLLAERLPEQLFFKRLRQAFERAPLDGEPTEPDSAVERLCRTAKGLEDLDPGLVDVRHKLLVELHREAGFEIRAAANAEASVRPVVGYEEHEAAIGRMIATADRQLILGNPWIRAGGLLDRQPGMSKAWFDMLDAALSRGVQVFFLWGIQADSRLDDQARNALLDLGARYPGRLFLSPRSATLHAKLVVRDAHAALLTSYNFLDPSSQRDSLEVGLLVEGSEPGIAPAAVLDALEWARNRYPDHLTAQRILLTPHEMGASEPIPPTIPPTPEAFDAVAAQRENGTATSAVRHWAQEWAATADELASLAEAHAGGAELLIDREHRETLWRALRGSVDRLAVLSDQLSVDVVTDRFARMLRARLESGTRCAFVYRREGASDRDDGPSARIREQADAFAESCSLVEARSHAKILISDDEITVGSFNFLSYGGEYAGSTSGPERAELSLRVRSADAVDQVLSALADAWPQAFQPLRKPRMPAPEVAAAGRAPRSLQPLFRAMGSTPAPADALLQWFERTATPWGDLESLERAGVSKETLTAAIGAAIATAPMLDARPATEWRSRLADLRWSSGDFIGCALLLPKGGTSSVPAWLADLGASVQARSATFSPSLPTCDAMSPDERTAAVDLLLVGVLDHGRFEYLDLLANLEQALDVPSAACVAAARQFFTTVYQPLPLELLRKNANRRQRREDEEHARADFSEALQAAENVGFRFPLGEHTWDLLKADGGLLGRARSALDGNTPDRLATYLEGEDGLGIDVERLMDEASHSARDEHSSRIGGPKRAACLTRLTRMVEKAKVWVHLASRADPTPSEARVLGACWDLQAALHCMKGDVPGGPCGVAAPVRKFAIWCLQPLFDAERP